MLKTDHILPQKLMARKIFHGHFRHKQTASDFRQFQVSDFPFMAGSQDSQRLGVSAPVCLIPKDQIFHDLGDTGSGRRLQIFLEPLPYHHLRGDILSVSMLGSSYGHRKSCAVNGHMSKFWEIFDSRPRKKHRKIPGSPDFFPRIGWWPRKRRWVASP